jgi:hypothetical protein
MSDYKNVKPVLNLNQGFSKEDLVRLLSLYDDDAGNHMIWVDMDGNVEIAVLTDLTATEMEDVLKGRIKFHYETLAGGNRYVGIEAADDEKYVSELYDLLFNDWKIGRQGLIENE